MWATIIPARSGARGVNGSGAPRPRGHGCARSPNCCPQGDEQPREGRVGDVHHRMAPLFTATALMRSRVGIMGGQLTTIVTAHKSRRPFEVCILKVRMTASVGTINREPVDKASLSRLL